MQERVRKKLIMPDLIGLRERDAQIMLTNTGFNTGEVRFVESYDDIGTVIQQDPIKGQLIDSSTPIAINVSKKNYIRFLPQIYQTNSSMGNSFLKEYLWIFQHLVESISSKLDDNHEYFDARYTPEQFLPWLAGWIALTLDIDWEPTKKRQFIRSAAQQYKYRGTSLALTEMLHIFVGKRPVINENTWPYRGFRIGVTSTMGEDTIILPPLNLDHCFIVELPIRHDEITEEMVVKVHNIINMEKPAHTTYFLQFKTDGDTARPQLFMQIGISSTIGDAKVTYEEEPTDSEPVTGDDSSQSPKTSEQDVAAPPEKSTKPARSKSAAKPKSSSAKAAAKSKNTTKKQTRTQRSKSPKKTKGSRTPKE